MLVLILIFSGTPLFITADPIPVIKEKKDFLHLKIIFFFVNALASFTVAVTQ